MNIFVFSSMSAFITSLVISFFVLLKGYRNPKRNVFITIALLAGTWCLFPAVASLFPSPSKALFGVKVVYISALFTGPAFLAFGLTIAEVERDKFEKRLIIISYIVAALFIPLLFSQLMIKGVLKFQPYFALIVGPAYPIFVLFFAASCLYSLYRLLMVFKNSKSRKRNQVKYVFIAYFIAFLSAVMHFGSAYGLYELFPHDILVIICMGVLAYAIAKHRFMDIQVAVTRAGIFLIVYTLVLGFPLGLAYTTTFRFLPIFIMFILATVGPLIYRYFQQKAEDKLLAQQKHYRRILMQAAAGMVREHNLDRLLRLIVYIIRKVVRVEFAAMFLDDKQNRCYRLKTIRGHHNIPDNFNFSYQDSLINSIKQKKNPLVYDDLSPLLTEPLKKTIHLVVPSLVEDNLLAFLALGEKVDRTFYTEDDINVFRILSRQTALAIENAIFFAEFKKVEERERVLTAEKLALVSGMADGVAHQIRNRLNAFAVIVGEQKFEIRDFIKAHAKLIVQTPSLKKTLDYIMQTANSVSDEVKRTAEIISGVINYARVEEKEISFSEFSFREIVDNALNLVGVKHQVARVPLEIVSPSIDTVYGIKGQIMECIYNILDNAYEAIKEKVKYKLDEEEKKKFSPGIKVKFIQKENSSLIEITDNGVGIKEEDKKKIFAPFFTTKSSYISGAGIGMYVVRRLIEEKHRGRIWFESEYMKGTTFYIELLKSQR